MLLLQLFAMSLCSIAPSESTLLALGDSYTIGEGVAEEERWPMQLVQQLCAQQHAFVPPKIIAKTGWTTDELHAGIQEHQLAESYDWVTLLIGVNNQYRGRDLGEYREQFRQLLELAIEKANYNPKRVMVLSIPDWGVTPFATKQGREPELVAEQIDQFNQVNREETELLQAHYIDITRLTRDAAAEPDRFLVADQLHPSAEMYRDWATRAAAVIMNAENAREPGPP
jgi:lysophospholipase L1-like esterase